MVDLEGIDPEVLPAARVLDMIRPLGIHTTMQEFYHASLRGEFPEPVQIKAPFDGEHMRILFRWRRVDVERWYVQQLDRSLQLAG